MGLILKIWRQLFSQSYRSIQKHRWAARNLSKYRRSWQSCSPYKRSGQRGGKSYQDRDKGGRPSWAKPQHRKTDLYKGIHRAGGCQNSKG